MLQRGPEAGRRGDWPVTSWLSSTARTIPDGQKLPIFSSRDTCTSISSHEAGAINGVDRLPVAPAATFGRAGWCARKGALLHPGVTARLGARVPSGPMSAGLSQ